MEPIFKVVLCSACSQCPEVAVYDNEVRIGEEGNLVRLKKSEWNEIVKKIKRGELKELD